MVKIKQSTLHKKLENFILNERNKIASNPRSKNTIGLQDQLVGLLNIVTFALFFLFGIISFISIELFKNGKSEVAKIALYTGLAVGLVAALFSILYLTIQSFNFFWHLKAVSLQPVEQIKKYNANNYLDLISEIGKSESSTKIKEAEIFFKLQLIKRNNNVRGMTNALPFLAASIVLFILQYFAIINLTINQDFPTWLNNSVSLIVGMATILIAILQLLIYVLSRDIAIYNEYILILQEALSIAKDKESTTSISQ